MRNHAETFRLGTGKAGAAQGGAAGVMVEKARRRTAAMRRPEKGNAQYEEDAMAPRHAPAAGVGASMAGGQ